MSDGTPPEGMDRDHRAAARIAEALRGLAFGSIEITVHDGQIVQIERREKTRVDIPVDTDTRSTAGDE